MAKAWFHNGEPLTLYLPCLWRVDLRDPLLRQRRMDGLNIDGQMFSACRGVLSTLLPKQAGVAIRFVGFISAVDIVADLVPTGVQF